MEQDIKNLQEIINLCNEELDNEDENVTAVLDLVDLKSLRNLIKAYKELEEENMQLEAIKDEAIRRYNFESIPVSLVKKKIEELNNSIDLAIDNSKGGLDEEFIEKGSKLLAQKKVLQELLEKRK